VDNEASGYRLTVGRYSGNAGDALHKHSGIKFSTYDRDNDGIFGNGAAVFGTGFWLYMCARASLNGMEACFWAGLPNGSNLHATKMWLMC